jgi:hypothetical protein
MRAAAAQHLTFPLATFLCAAGPRWHLDYTWAYEFFAFVPGELSTHAVPGQPLLQSYTPDEWYPDLRRAPGTPLGDCVYNEATFTFSREWTRVSVSLNVEEETAVIRWKEEA